LSELLRQTQTGCIGGPGPGRDAGYRAAVGATVSGYQCRSRRKTGARARTAVGRRTDSQIVAADTGCSEFRAADCMRKRCQPAVNPGRSTKKGIGAAPGIGRGKNEDGTPRSHREHVAGGDGRRIGPVYRRMVHRYHANPYAAGDVAISVRVAEPKAEW